MPVFFQVRLNGVVSQSCLHGCYESLTLDEETEVAY